MSNVNINQPLQLIRHREGKFEVPPETADFLKTFTNPLGVITIVGKYRTGKSLFLNKVLLRKSAFKVSPTIQSCTKGLWLCREVLKSENPSEETDLLVLDTEGFGAPEETDQYNHKILLFAMLLSSYFIYNSVGSIDENSLNSLNLVSQLTRQILKNNSKDEKADEESPAFLWLLRDFALNLVDKNGSPIQAKDYLQQSLEFQKGSSDSIESKNKIRRMLKLFFKDRDCFTLVRPVETEEHLQNLLYLPEQSYRTEFVEQANQLRSKILKKIRSKRIKGRSLNGEMLLQLANSYIQVVNRGDLPNFQLSYKHIMRIQTQRSAADFVNICKNRLNSFTNKLLSKVALEKLENQLAKDLQNRFKELNNESQEMKVIVEASKRQIQQTLNQFIQSNAKRCQQNCESAWKNLYESSRQFDNHEQIQSYFNQLLDDLKAEMNRQSNPIDVNYLTTMVYKQQIKKMSSFGDEYKKKSTEEAKLKQNKINELQQQVTLQSKQLKQFQDLNHQLNRQVNKLSSKLAELQKVKDMEITYLRQKQTDYSQQISQTLFKLQQTSQQLQQCKSSLLENQMRNEQLNRSLRQTSEEKRLTQKELQIIRHNLEVKNQEINDLRAQLSEANVRLEGALEKQSFILSKQQTQMENKNNQYITLSKKSQAQLEQITKLSLEVQQLQRDLDHNCSSLERERSMYEKMFQSFKDNLKLQNVSRQELIETNKNLSAALKNLEKRVQQAEEKEKQLKQYKKCVKNSSCLQCQHCTKFFVPSIFLPHLNVCLIGPEALKTTKPDLKQNNQPKLQIKIKETLIKQSQGKPFTEYVLSFKRGNKEWTINRKYKSFCDLHSALKGALPGVEFSEVSYIVNPQEVSKKSLVIEERRKILEKYMNDLEKNPFVSVTPIWADFIEEPQSPMQSQRSSPLKENIRYGNQQPTPEQFFKVWNERQIRGKQSLTAKGGRWKLG